MRFSDIARSCTQNLLRRKSRTILTVLGVIVGCCSIVLMISIGQGINEQNEQMLKNMGNLNDITVYADGGGSHSTATSSSVSGADGEQAKLDDDAVQNFRSIAGVAGVLPQKTMSYSVGCHARSWLPVRVAICQRGGSRRHAIGRIRL